MKRILIVLFVLVVADVCAMAPGVRGGGAGVRRVASPRRFTPEEDQLLAWLAEFYNEESWDIVAARISEVAAKAGRPPVTARQCRERWVHYVSGGAPVGTMWSEEEDALLLERVDHYGPASWTFVALGFPHRSSNAVRCRWQKLKRSRDGSVGDSVEVGSREAGVPRPAPVPPLAWPAPIVGQGGSLGWGPWGDPNPDDFGDL
jgi:hypothetical protein